MNKNEEFIETTKYKENYELFMKLKKNKRDEKLLIEFYETFNSDMKNLLNERLDVKVHLKEGYKGELLIEAENHFKFVNKNLDTRSLNKYKESYSNLLESSYLNFKRLLRR